MAVFERLHLQADIFRDSFTLCMYMYTHTYTCLCAHIYLIPVRAGCGASFSMVPGRISLTKALSLSRSSLLGSVANELLGSSCPWPPVLGLHLCIAFSIGCAGLGLNSSLHACKVTSPTHGHIFPSHYSRSLYIVGACGK